MKEKSQRLFKENVGNTKTMAGNDELKKAD